MSDLTHFETRLANMLSAEASAGIRPVDAHAVARWIIDSGVRRGWSGDAAKRSWLMPIAATLAVLAIVGIGIVLPGSGLLPGPGPSPTPSAGPTPAASLSPSPDPTPSPPAVTKAIWPGFKLLSDEDIGVSVQVPEGWGRSVRIQDGFVRILEAGSGTAGLTVLRPTATSDLESTVGALMDDSWAAEWQPYTRAAVTHGSHRAVRLDSRTRADGQFIGGSILYVVERPDDRPVVLSLAWDSAPDLGHVEEAIIRSFNVDGPGPAVYDSNPEGSNSFVTMTDGGCNVARPQLETTQSDSEVTIANQTEDIADLNLLRVGANYDALAYDVQQAADAIAEGLDPTWSNTGSTWITDSYLEPHSDGVLNATMVPGIYAAMCFPVGDSDESLGVYLTLPFEVVASKNP